jgi:uncharacterized membrane protein YgdD (TMEM256/DUF423 family)
MVAVILAAAGSHIFKLDRSSEMYLLFNNAVVFQLLHAILLLWLCSLKSPDFWIRSTIISMLIGVFLFCGGLYVLVLFGKSSFTWLIPVGGSLLILGWLNLSISGFKNLGKPD